MKQFVAPDFRKKLNQLNNLRSNIIPILLLAFFTVPSWRSAYGGGFTFAENNGLDIITHPVGYAGTGGVLNITVGIDPASPNAADMVISVQNIIAVFNGLQATTDNLSLGSDNNIPSGFVDFESVALHEFGHAVGLSHCNLASESGLSGANQNYTKATVGPGGSYGLNAGTDGVRGSSDDVRGDDENLHWFKIADNNPFTVSGTIDATTYSRDIADLPGGHNFPANADRDVSTLMGFSNTEAIMQQGSFSDEAQRTLAADDVATFKLAMAGIDETANTSDDYTVNFTYAGLTTSADIVFKFDNAQTGFAVTQSSGSFLSGHVLITSTAIFFNTGFSWFFNDVSVVSNIPPEITGQSALSTPEETALTITLGHLTVTDPDNTYPDDFTLSVQNGTNYTRSGNTITPVADFNGTLTVPVTVNDGTDNSNTFNLSVTVSAVNDPPEITGQSALSTPEETALAISLGDLTVTDPDNTYPDDFTLSVQNGTNYTRSGNTITPVDEFNGSLSVPVTVSDGSASSNTFLLSVTVTAINDPPIITGQNPLTTLPETALTITLDDLLVTDPDNTWPDDFSLSVQDGTNYSRVGDTITPDPGFTGTLTVPVTVDDGGTLRAGSNVFNLQVSVETIAAPVITSHPADGIVCLNTFTSLSVTATGAAPLDYQWRKNTIDIPGEIGATLIIDPVTNGDAGSYDCRVTNLGGSVLSDPAVITTVELSASLSPSVQALGLSPLELDALFSCDTAGLEWVWENLNTSNLFGLNTNPVTLPPISANATIELSAGPDGGLVSPVAQSLVLVSTNPFYLDPDEDGCNTIADLFFVLDHWNNVGPGDPDDDGIFTLLDLLYINTQDPLPCIQ